MRRPRMCKLIGVLAALLLPAAEVLASDYLVYVGTYTGNGSEGIYAYRFNPATGETRPIGLAAATDNPSFLAVDPKAGFLYAVNELDTSHGEPTGLVSVFAIDRESATLIWLQEVSSLGGDPAYVSLDRSARYLMVANYDVFNYAGGSYAVFPIGPDGRLGPHAAYVRESGSSINPERQAGPHPHCIQVTPDNRFIITADLGLDKLFVDRFDARTGVLTPGSPRIVRADPGAGPRHVAFAPSGKLLYVVNELASTVTVYSYDPGLGTLAGKQTVSTLPKDFAGKNTAAEIAVDGRGRFLYVSNRGDDSIAVFGIDPENGALTPAERVPSGGRAPRNFAIDPTGRWMFVANQESNEIRLFEIDPGTGRLRATPRSVKIISPVFVLFVSLYPPSRESNDAIPWSKSDIPRCGEARRLSKSRAP
jgi:6-phosphogluconolactonase